MADILDSDFEGMISDDDLFPPIKVVQMEPIDDRLSSFNSKGGKKQELSVLLNRAKDYE